MSKNPLTGLQVLQLLNSGSVDYLTVTTNAQFETVIEAMIASRQFHTKQTPTDNAMLRELLERLNVSPTTCPHCLKSFQNRRHQ